MSPFDKAVEFVLAREGGLSENPHDSGGITNYGISLRFLREVEENKLRRYGIFEPVNEDTVRSLTLEQAKFIYRGEFWEGNRFEEINSQHVCSYIFDMVVAHGMASAIRIVQRGLCAVALTRGYVRDDGIFGELTLGAINSVGNEELLVGMVAIRVEFYRNLVVVRAKDEVFLEGWLNRAYSVG